MELTTFSPIVSIVIATCNRAELLQETISSILDQDYWQFELLVIADGSDTEAKEALTHFNDSRIIFVQPSASCTGPAKVRNYGINIAKGDYIAFCDDDDLWMHNKLSKQMLVFENDKSISLVASNAKYNTSELKSSYIYGNIKNYLNALYFIGTRYKLALYNCLVLSSVIVKKEVLLEIGLFNEELDFQSHEDLDLWFRIAKKHKSQILIEKLIQYRMHEQQISNFKGRIEYKNKSLTLTKNTSFASFNLLQKLIFSIRNWVFLIGKQ